MPVIFRTAGAWGAGKGSDLTAAEVDGNFWDHEKRLDALEASPPEPDTISNIEVVGGQMTIHTESGGSFGPFALPVAIFGVAGDWTAATDYNFLDIVSVQDAGDDTGTYLVLQDHTSAATFDPLATSGGNPLYHFMVPPGPTGATGATGPEGDVGPGVPPGGIPGQLLTKSGLVSYETEWTDPAAVPTPIVFISDATYTLQATDNMSYLRFVNAAGCEVTVDVMIFAEGNEVAMIGTLGQITLVEGAGMNISQPASCALASREAGSAIHLMFISDALADLTGDLELAP